MAIEFEVKLALYSNGEPRFASIYTGDCVKKGVEKIAEANVKHANHRRSFTLKFNGVTLTNESAESAIGILEELNVPG